MEHMFLKGGVAMNYTELFVTNFYQSINISGVHSLSIDVIVNRLNIELRYWQYVSSIAYDGGQYYVFINDSVSTQRQWQEFGHEMYHYLYDETTYNKFKKTYADYGESKADYFAYHFCVPTFMLIDIKNVSVYDIMEIFNVEFDFALRRLEMYKGKFLRSV